MVRGLLIHLACLALLWRMTQRVRTDLRAMRTELETVAENPAAKEPSIARVIEAIDQALTRQGFPKPNPMLAE